MQNAKGRFNHAPNAKPCRRAGALQQQRRLPHHVGTFDLGQDNPISAARRHRDQIVAAPRRVQPIDPDQDFTTAIAAFRQRRGNIGSRLILSVRRDRVLQIEDKSVRRQGTAFLQGAWVRSRHVKSGTARANLGLYIASHGGFLSVN